MYGQAWTQPGKGSSLVAVPATDMFEDLGNLSPYPLSSEERGSHDLALLSNSKARLCSPFPLRVGCLIGNLSPYPLSSEERGVTT